VNGFRGRPALEKVSVGHFNFMAKKTEKSGVIESIVEFPRDVEVMPTKVLVCVGGYNHAANQSGDCLEIPVAGLPKQFNLKGVVEGYFPIGFKRRFAIKEHSQDEKVLRLKIKLL
jgi:hypothetical protein